MDEIIRLVLRRNKERRLLNKNDMQRICEIIKGLNNLDYDIDFKIKCEDNSDAAGCCYSDNIEFYKEGMEKYIEEHYDVFNSKFDYDGSKVDVHNFFILSIIFHEFTHAKQHRIRDFGYNSPEKKLFGICYRLMDLKTFYDDNYRRYSTEIDANSRGAINSYNVYRHFPKEFLTEKDKNILAMHTCDSLIERYRVLGDKEMIISPSELLYKAADEFNVSKVGVDINKFKEIITNKQDITIYRKLLLGLPVSFLEFSYANLLSNVLHNGQNFDFIKGLQKKL